MLLGALTRKKWTEDDLFNPSDNISSEAHTAYQHYKSIVNHTSEKDKLSLARTFVAPGRIAFLRPWKPLGQATLQRQFQVSILEFSFYVGTAQEHHEQERV